MRIDVNMKRPTTVVGKTRKAVVRLIRDLFLFEAAIMHEVPPTYNHFHLEKWLEKTMLNKAERCLIATVENKVVGVLLNESADHTAIRVLYVTEAMRGNLIGETLINLFQRGYPDAQLTVECLEKNEKALAFYERQGFIFDEPPYEVNGCNNVKGYYTVNV